MFGFITNTIAPETDGKEFLVQCAAMTGREGVAEYGGIEKRVYFYKFHFDAVAEKAEDGFPLHFEVEFIGPINKTLSARSELRQFYESWAGRTLDQNWHGSDFLNRHAFIAVSSESVLSIRPA